MNRREMLVIGLLLAALTAGSVTSYVVRVRRQRLSAAALSVVASEPESLDATAKLVDINTASVQQLQALPGIGPVLAQRIVSLRTARGGFRAVDELDDVSGIGPKRLAAIRELITVGATQLTGDSEPAPDRTR